MITAENKVKLKKKEYSKVRNQIEIECDICQCKVRKSAISKHLKTLKHIENENKVKTTVEEEKPNEIENSSEGQSFSNCR